jgi:hypothetical protein
MQDSRVEELDAALPPACGSQGSIAAEIISTARRSMDLSSLQGIEPFKRRKHLFMTFGARRFWLWEHLQRKTANAMRDYLTTSLKLLSALAY